MLTGAGNENNTKIRKQTKLASSFSLSTLFPLKGRERRVVNTTDWLRKENDGWRGDDLWKTFFILSPTRNRNEDRRKREKKMASRPLENSRKKIRLPNTGFTLIHSLLRP